MLAVWLLAALIGNGFMSLGISTIEAGEPSSAALPTRRAMDVYASTLQASEIPVFLPSTETSGSCRNVGLYQPSLDGVVSLVSARPRKLPDTGGVKAMYAPLLPGPVVFGQAAMPTSRTDAIYGTSLQTSVIPNMEPYGIGGLVDAAYWDEGVGMSGVSGWRFGLGRRSMYATDSDVMAILYDLGPEPVEEPPRELSKVSMPTYRIEPPDLLVIEAIKLVPRPPFRIGIYDVLLISASGTIPDQPIGGYFLVEAEGIVSLGPGYEPIRVVGMTIDEAAAEITWKLKETLAQPGVTVQLSRSGSTQQVSGIYEVQSDGMVNMGNYGQIYISGKTVAETSTAIERHLVEYFDSPEVTVEVIEYKSQGYYIIIAGAESGETVLRLPVSGNDTVLDAISYINGLPYVSSKTMWVARPAPGGMTCQDILPVDYSAITRGGITDTNYQLLPGDRLYIVDDRLVASDTFVGNFLNPIGRMLRISRLGTIAIRGTQTMGRGYNQRRRGGF